MFRFTENKGFVAQQICGALLPLAESAALAGNQSTLRTLLQVSCFFTTNAKDTSISQLRANSALYLKLLQVGALYGEPNPENEHEANTRPIPISPTELTAAIDKITNALVYLMPDHYRNIPTEESDAPRYTKAEYTELYNMLCTLTAVFNSYEHPFKFEALRSLYQITSYVRLMSEKEE